MSALGKTFGDVIILSPTAQDYSAEVAQATGGADCVISIISETPFITWNTAWAQSGTDAQQYGPQGNLNEISAARLFNRSVVYSQLKNGKVVPLTTDFEDVSDLATGNAG